MKKIATIIVILRCVPPLPLSCPSKSLGGIRWESEQRSVCLWRVTLCLVQVMAKVEHKAQHSPSPHKQDDKDDRRTHRRMQGFGAFLGGLRGKTNPHG